MAKKKDDDPEKEAEAKVKVKSKSKKPKSKTISVVKAKKPSALSLTTKMLSESTDQVLSHFVPLDRKRMEQAWPHVPVGNIKFEYLLGGEFNSMGQNACPGFPRGLISNIFGAEHSGKTSLALHAAAETARRGGNILYIDYENVLDVRYASKLGVPVYNPDQFGLYQPETLEQGVAALMLAANTGVDLIVLDSVGAAVPKKFFEMSVEEIAEGKVNEVALQARKWSNFLPRITKQLKQGSTALLAISQTRSGGPGQLSSSVQGGRGWTFFAAVRMELKKMGTLKAKRYDALSHKTVDRKIGTIVKAIMKKSKVSGTTHWEAEIGCLPYRGFDPLLGVVDVAITHKVIKKGGSWYTWERRNGEEIRIQGYDSFIEVLRKDRRCLSELETVVRPLLTAQDMEENFSRADENSAEDIAEYESIAHGEPKQEDE